MKYCYHSYYSTPDMLPTLSGILFNWLCEAERRNKQVSSPMDSGRLVSMLCDISSSSSLTSLPNSSGSWVSLL